MQSRLDSASCAIDENFSTVDGSSLSVLVLADFDELLAMVGVVCRCLAACADDEYAAGWTSS